MSAGERRRRLTHDGADWLAVEAWRARGGDRLLYFLRLENDQPAADDREDRRARLEPVDELTSLDEEELRVRWSGAAPLTSTERRFNDRDGVPWLAQSVGPVWAGEGVAAGLTGLTFTRLDGSGTRVTSPAEAPAALVEEELREIVLDARGDGKPPNVAG